MANQIDRDAFVKRDVLKNPIPYTRGTDLLPIVIHFRDFQIPSGATARVFVAKADGNAVYTTATIDGNDVTVDVTDQMFIELGTALMQISIMDGEEELVSFVQPVDVQQNLKAGDLPASTTDVKFLDEAIEQANEAVNTATTAAQQAATAVKNANTAVSNANAAIADLNEQIASLDSNFATLARTVNISQLQTSAKNIVAAVNELNSKSYLLEGGTLIPEGSNLDDYKTPGNYYCSPSLIVPTIQNIPPASNFAGIAFTLKVEMGAGTINPIQTYREYRNRNIATRVWISDSWTEWSYQSNDTTLFTPQNVAITDGDYGHVNGNFKRIGSLLVFSFWITLTKDYSTTYDTLFTFNAIRSVGRYDFPAFGTYNSDLKVIDFLVSTNSNRPNLNIGSGATIPQSSTIFCSGAMIIADL